MPDITNFEPETVIERVIYVGGIVKKIIEETFCFDVNNKFVYVNNTNWCITFWAKDVPLKITIDCLYLKCKVSYLYKSKARDVGGFIKEEVENTVVQLIKDYRKENPPNEIR